MKVTIFGATGTIGRFLVDQALMQGHEVTAFTRSPDGIGQSADALHVFNGDVRDPVAVANAIEGQDAVICALGMPLLNKEGLRATGTRNIVTAMETAGVKRFVCLSGLGAGDSWSLLPWHYKYLIVPLMMRRLFKDHNAQEEYVRKSSLDWIIARPSNFAKEEGSRPYEHGFSKLDPAFKLKMAPPDIADFMLRQLTDDVYLRQSPALSY
ncbi:SDR family oxidoreductase [Sneathiella marina]|uniref:SDR family oxidoreductase n=1 Tax=Sneathiella marina TaxID=2950108 RepID=A0ABY4W078_9PROT|nr:SDR family oxidoreductase [Sneathiella marina]USG60590.1 SDR family oxidoreductase [Sneathiella marina]